jgi:hypothetical protein
VQPSHARFVSNVRVSNARDCEVLERDVGWDSERNDRDGEKIRQAMQVVVRQWRAEEENSRRLAVRTNGILATIAAASGLGLFKLSDLPEMEPLWVDRVVGMAIALSGCCMLVGLIHIWGLRAPRWTPDERWWLIPRKLFRFIRRASQPAHERNGVDQLRHPFASSWLHTTADPTSERPVQEPDLLSLQTQAIRRIEYYRTQMAALDLYTRNVERQTALTCGQTWLGRAVLVAFVTAVACVILDDGGR